MTLSEALEQYRSRISILKKGYQQERYRIEQIGRSPLGKLEVNAITSVDIATYRDQRLSQINPKTQKTLSTSTVRLELSLLSHLFDIAKIEWGVCETNPVSNVRKPKIPPGRDRRITPREERLILRYAHNHSNPQLYSIIVLALETAMRQGEILGMSWEHINLKSRVVHLPDTKNNTPRDVPLSLKARDAIIRMGVQSKGKLFSLSPAGLKSSWRYMMKSLKIEDLHFHDARHECVSRLFELGSLDMMEISAISGHKSLSMLKRYTHLKAHRLVRKLEGHKNKGKQAVLDCMIPYPAELVREKQKTTIRLLDFTDLKESAANEQQAIRLAQDALLRRIMVCMRDSVPIPPADQYLEVIDEKKIIMIDPLGPATA
jgi:integrase